MDSVKLEGSQEVEAAGRQIRDAATVINVATLNLIQAVNQLAQTTERLTKTIEKLDVQEVKK
jgi:hypothetical protein